MDKILFFDVETTGLSHKKHSIHELAGLVEVDGEVVEEFKILLRPHPRAQIEPSALAVAKVTLEEVMAYPPQEEGYSDFIDILNRYVDPFDPRDKYYLSGFNNASFDNHFLRVLFDLNQNSYFAAYFHAESLDVMTLAGQYLRGARRAAMPSFKLHRVATELGLEVDHERLHEGVYDVQLTRAIYRIVTGLEIEL